MASNKSSEQNLNIESSPQLKLRMNINILFIGLSVKETAPIITLLRASRISSRGKSVNSEKEFLEALAERSWDLIICTTDTEFFSIREAIHHIKRLNRDIPIIQIIPVYDSHIILQGLKNQMQAVVHLDEKELLLIKIRRELEHLEVRKRLRKAEAELAESNKRLHMLTISSKQAITCSLDGKLIFVNDSFLELFGYENKEQIIGQQLTDFFSSESRSLFNEQFSILHETRKGERNLKVNALRSDYSEFEVEIELSAADYNGQSVIRTQFDADDCQLGYHILEEADETSGLLGEEHLYNRLEQVIKEALTGGRDHHLLYIELDDLEQVRSKFGPEGGEQLLQDVAIELRKQVVSPHLLTYSEDDAFILVYCDSDTDKTQDFAKNLCDVVAQNESSLNGETFRTTCSIGIAIINDNSPSQMELIVRAMAAAQRLKEETGEGNGIRLHIPEQVTDILGDDESEKIRDAVKNKNFKLMFQPIVSLIGKGNQAGKCYELSIRLIDEKQRQLSPNDFMASINDALSMLSIDRWVLEESIKLLKETSERDDIHTLFVNISGHAITDKNLVTWLSSTLKKYNVSANNLVLQISESHIESSPHQAKIFTEKLHKLGCQICIKHFGSSMNALSTLTTVHSDFIKMDGSYILDLGKDSLHDEQLSEQLRQLSKMGRTTIAPLVDSPKVMTMLWKAGFDLVQGHYLQSPSETMSYDFSSTTT